MHTLQMILFYVLVFGLLLGGLLIAIFKGSRPPQPLPRNPMPSRRAALGAAVPVLCALIIYATFRAVDFYLKTHLYVPMPASVVVLLLGIIGPWFVGIYFAYVAARAERIPLRAIGATEVLIFSLAGILVLIAR